MRHTGHLRPAPCDTGHYTLHRIRMGSPYEAECSVCGWWRTAGGEVLTHLWHRSRAVLGLLRPLPWPFCSLDRGGPMACADVAMASDSRSSSFVDLPTQEARAKRSAQINVWFSNIWLWRQRQVIAVFAAQDIERVPTRNGAAWHLGLRDFLQQVRGQRGRNRR